MLCDVSGSMDAFNPFLLRLMFGLQQALKNSRTLVFSTHVTEITALLRRRSVQDTLREVGESVRQWSGGTNIGGALATLNRGVLREGAYADLTLFDADTIDSAATYEDPIAPARGIDTVIVNGAPVWRGGRSTGARPGRVLAREAQGR